MNSQRAHVPAHKLAMAWVFQHPDVTNVLVGARKLGVAARSRI